MCAELQHVNMNWNSDKCDSVENNWMHDSHDYSIAIKHWNIVVLLLFLFKMSFEHIDRLIHWLVCIFFVPLSCKRNAREFHKNQVSISSCHQRWQTRNNNKNINSYRLFVFAFGNSLLPNSVWNLEPNWPFFPLYFHTSLTYLVILMM